MKSAIGSGKTIIQAIAAAAVAFPTHSAAAQARTASAPITDVSYEITADSAAVGNRKLGIAMSFHVAA